MTWNALNAFEKGRHREVVEHLRPPGHNPGETLALIGSLSFLGRVEEAQEIWRLRGERLSARQRARARFTIAVACTRISRFKTSRRFLKANLQDLECKNCPDVYQGLGFYSFHFGRFPQALKYARLALRTSIQQDDDYIRTLALDLYGHTLVQTGKRLAGIRYLNQARELAARDSANDPFVAAILIYEAEAGFRPETIVEELKKTISNSPANSYTRADLVLELARQLTLRGQWDRARRELDQIAPTIYGFEHRRQEATLQLRLSELSYRQGDAFQTSHFLQSARRCLNSITDHVYELRILGLQLKLQTRLLEQVPDAAALARLKQLSGKHPGLINGRIVARDMDFKPAAPTGEDPLGNLMDLCRLNPRAAESLILNQGYLGLWPESRNIKPGQRSLYVLENGSWIAVRRAGVVRGTGPLTPLSRSLLFRLARGLASKQDLVHAAWGYSYDPLRHDGMVYTALNSLRKMLGEASDWIEAQDQGWLARDVNFGSPLTASPPELTNPPVESSAPTHKMNWRQLKALQISNQKRRWNVPKYRKRFNVSVMTAWRDLDGLVKTGYFQRIGRGRSTMYIKREDR